jgi:hypothetical protein
MRTIRVAVVVSFLFAVVSCKKSSSSPSVQSEIVGTWVASKDAVDLNGNGVMEANEIYADTSFPGATLVFSSSGTFSDVFMGIPLVTGSWKLVNNNTYLETSDTLYGGSTDYQHIDNLTTTSLTLRDTTGGQTSWTILTKK